MFRYRALNAAREVVIGEIEATDLRDAARRLQRQGLTPLHLDAPKNLVKATLFPKKPSAIALRLALTQLAVLVQSGVNLGEACGSLARSAGHPVLTEAFEKVHQSLKRGDPLSKALFDSELALPSYFKPLVEAGELAGQLGTALERGVQQMEQAEQFQNELRQALTYPLILIVTGILAVILVFALVVPRFVYLLEQNPNLPALAWIVLKSGEIFNEFWPIIVAVLVSSAVGFLSLINNAYLQKQLWQWSASWPIVGHWLRDMDLGTWAGLAATLLSQRVALLTGLELAKQSVQTIALQRALNQANQQVKGGHAVEVALREAGVLTPMGLDLIRVGERSGQLPQMFQTISTLYQNQVQRRTKQLLTLVEPIAILLIGTAIGIIMAGIVLAITSMNEIR